MPKYFYILYFSSIHTSFVEYLTNAAREIFQGALVESSIQAGKYTKLAVTSNKPIYPWEIDQVESLFGNFIGEILFSHDSATVFDGEVASMEEVDPQYTLSVGVILNFSLWDVITLKKFFFVRNLRKMVLNGSDTAGFYFCDNFLCFFIQSDKPILDSEIDFYIETVKPVSSALFKTKI